MSDQGPGIPPEAMKHVFERFFRADAALNSKTGGLGLGLSISYALAKDMGGALSVAARDCGGCVFTLELPAPGGQSDASVDCSGCLLSRVIWKGIER